MLPASGATGKPFLKGPPFPSEGPQEIARSSINEALRQKRICLLLIACSSMVVQLLLFPLFFFKQYLPYHLSLWVIVKTLDNWHQISNYLSLYHLDKQTPLVPRRSRCALSQRRNSAFSSSSIFSLCIEQQGPYYLCKVWCNRDQVYRFLFGVFLSLSIFLCQMVFVVKKSRKMCAHLKNNKWLLYQAMG